MRNRNVPAYLKKKIFKPNKGLAIVFWIAFTIFVFWFSLTADPDSVILWTGGV